jgi:hypothetical protein
MENTCRVVVTFMPHVKHSLWKKKKRDCRQDDGRCVTSLTKLEPQCYLTANDGQACWTDCEARRAGGQILNTLFISFCPCNRGRFISHAGASSTFWRQHLVAWPAGWKQHAQRMTDTWNRLDYIGWALLFSQRCRWKWDTKLLHFCCRDRVLSVWMTSSFQYFILKKENNRIKVNYWPKLLRSRLWYHANEYNWVAPIWSD